MQVINRENETISPITPPTFADGGDSVICAFIGTTQVGWNFGVALSWGLIWFAGLALAVLFYGVMLAGVAMGRVIWWMARNYPQRPSLRTAWSSRATLQLRCFKRSGGALSTGLVVCAGRHGGAVLHRLPALPWYSELPEYQQRGKALASLVRRWRLACWYWKCCSP